MKIALKQLEARLSHHIEVDKSLLPEEDNGKSYWYRYGRIEALKQLYKETFGSEYKPLDSLPPTTNASTL